MYNNKTCCNNQNHDALRKSDNKSIGIHRIADNVSEPTRKICANKCVVSFSKIQNAKTSRHNATKNANDKSEYNLFFIL